MVALKLRKLSTPGARQRGLTMIELMIGMVLGLVMTGLVIQIFLSNRQTSRFAEAMSLIQEQGRFAVGVLGGEIQMAGYRIVPVTAVANPLQGANNTGVKSSDTYTVRYELTTPVDCTGAPVANPVVNVFAVATSATTGRPILTCNGVQLLDNVEAMQVLYGEDTDNDGAANRYVAAPPATMLNVVSMRVGVLLASDGLVSPDTAGRTYDLLGQVYGPFNDNRLRRVYSTTIKIRNRLG